MSDRCCDRYPYCFQAWCRPDERSRFSCPCEALDRWASYESERGRDHYDEMSDRDAR